MSVDMNSQGSDSNEEDYDPNCEEEEEEEEDPGDIEDYYVGVASDVEQQGADAFDPEEYQFTCLTYKESEGALHEHMTSLASALKVSHSVAKLILVNFHWQVSEILDRYRSNSAQLLVEARVQPNPSKHVPTAHPSPLCSVYAVCAEGKPALSDLPASVLPKLLGATLLSPRQRWCRCRNLMYGSGLSASNTRGLCVSLASQRRVER